MDSNYATPMRTPSQKNRRKAISPVPKATFSSPYEIVELNQCDDHLKTRILEQEAIISDLRETVKKQQHDMTLESGLNESIIIESSNRISTQENRVYRRDVEILRIELDSSKKQISALKDEISTLVSTNKNYEENLKKRVEEYQELDERTSELSQKNKQLEERLVEKERETNMISSKLLSVQLDYKSQCQDYRSQIAKLETRLKEVRSNLDDDRLRNKNQSLEIENLRRALAEAREDTSKYKELFRRNGEEQNKKELELRRSLEQTLVSSNENASRHVLNELKTISTQIIHINTPQKRPDILDEGSLQERIGALKATNAFMENHVAELQARCTNLEKELDASRHHAKLVREEADQLQKTLYDLEGDSEKSTKYLHDEIAKLTLQKADLRCEFLQFKHKHENCEEREKSKEDEISTTRDMISTLNTEKEDIISSLRLRVVELEEKEKELSENVFNSVTTWITKNIQLNSTEKSLALYESSQKDNSDLKAEIMRMQEKMVALVKHLEMSDEQCTKYRDMRNRSEASKARAVEQCSSLVEKVRSLESELERQRESESEVATLKADNDRLQTKIYYLNEELQETHMDYREELTRLAREVSESRQKAAQLQDTESTVGPKIDELRLQLSQRDSEIRSNKKRVEELRFDNEKLQEQLTDVRRRESTVVEENAKLRKGLADAVAKIEEYKREAEDARDTSSGFSKQISDKEKRIAKLEDEVGELSETLREKERLESYLQSQINVKQMPKLGRRSTLLRTLSETSIESNTSGMEQLENERAKLREILEEKKRRLNVLKDVTPNNQLSVASSGFVSQEITLTSQSKSTLPSASQGANGVMRHDIPHRWKDSRHISVFSMKCAVCFVGIPTFGKARKCVHCDVQVHAACASRVVNTCGLPDQCANYYLDHHTGFPDSSSGRMNGWIRLYRDDSPSASWISVWALMTESRISFYDNDGSDLGHPMLQVDLRNESWTVRTGAEMPVKCEDMTRVQNIIQLRTSQRIIFMLASSTQMARRWSDCLTSAHKKKMMLTRRPSSFSEYSCLLVLQTPNNLTIHSSYVFDDYLLLATQTGLFFTSYSQPRVPVRIAGLNSVSAMEFMPEVNCVCMVVGSIRSLALIPLDSLRYSLKSPQPSIRPDVLPNFQHVHIISYHQQDLHKFLVVADATKVHVLRHNPSRDVFSTYGFIEIAEPAICVQSASKGFYFGADSFYYVALNPSVPNDKIVARQLAESHVSDYPIAILPIRGDEVLLAYQNYGMFVNLKGEKTRKDTIEWEQMPMEFLYTAPYLYVVHYDSIEIMQVSENTGFESCTVSPEREVFQCENAHIIGKTPQDDVVISISSAESTEVHRFNATLGKRSVMKRRGMSSLTSLDKRSRN